jgi:hypothetical protein
MVAQGNAVKAMDASNGIRCFSGTTRCKPPRLTDITFHSIETSQHHKIHSKYPQGCHLTNTVKLQLLCLILSEFLISSTGRTGRLIFKPNSSNDRVLPNKVPFQGHNDDKIHLGIYFPP